VRGGGKPSGFGGGGGGFEKEDDAMGVGRSFCSACLPFSGGSDDPPTTVDCSWV